ncbi:MAG: MFS transporter, partial [Verrucomicrobia bacterium]|nr:MFS transporter [Verrucomicrobiota bacterium]
MADTQPPEEREDPEAGRHIGNDISALPQTSRLRSFWLMFVVEFQNAFSDNVLKFLVTYSIIWTAASAATRDSYLSLIGAIFALPFVLFSMAGGFFADRFSKRRVAIGIKCAELGIMTAATAGLGLHNAPLMLAAVFLMSTHSAIFGPTKYGMLPELLPERQLSWGNGIFGLGTYGAIITGMIFAGTLSTLFDKKEGWSGVVLLALAFVGLSLCVGVVRLPAADPAKKFRVNFVVDFVGQLRTARRDKVLFLGILGNAFLGFLGALLQAAIFIYGRDVLHLNQTQASWLQAALAVGIGVGSLAAGFLSGGKIEYGLVPLGLAGLAAFSMILSQAGFHFGAAACSLGLLGFFGGLYNVPLNAIIQHRPDPRNKGAVIAASTLLFWIGVLLASGVYYLLTVALGLSCLEVFLVGGGLCLAAAVYCVRLVPDSLIRLLLWLATSTVYRIRVEGRDNIPEKGGALFVCNHVSFVDGPLLMASTDRQIRFLMHRDYYERRWIKPFAKILRLIPIASDAGPREIIRSLQTAREGIRAG